MFAIKLSRVKKFIEVLLYSLWRTVTPRAAWAGFISPSEDIFDAAISGNAEDVERFIILGTAVDVRARNGATPLMCAVCNNPSVAVIEVLLNAGADVNARANDGMTSLMLAAMQNPSPDVIKLLLKAGADVNEKGDKGATPLMYAAKFNPCAAITDFLLNAGAKVEACKNDGTTSLMLAVENNSSVTVVETLLKAGANVNAQDRFGLTPLMYAANVDSPEKIAVLLEHGADVNLKAPDGTSAMKLARVAKTKDKSWHRFFGESKAIKLLKQAGASE